MKEQEDLIEIQHGILFNKRQSKCEKNCDGNADGVMIC